MRDLCKPTARLVIQGTFTGKETKIAHRFCAMRAYVWIKIKTWVSGLDLDLES